MSLDTDHSADAAELADATGAELYGFGNIPTRLMLVPMQIRPSARTTIFAMATGYLWGALISLRAAYAGALQYAFVFQLESAGILFSGDHIMGWSTTAVAPPDGDIAAYLASLQRIKQRTEWPCLAAHGAPVLQPAKMAVTLRSFVQARETRLLIALTSPHSEHYPHRRLGSADASAASARAFRRAHRAHLRC